MNRKESTKSTITSDNRKRSAVTQDVSHFQDSVVRFQISRDNINANGTCGPTFPSPVDIFSRDDMMWRGT